MTVFKFYNSTGEQLKSIDWIEIQWNRKCLETGNFSIYTNVENWNTEIKYIKNVGRPETGIVQKINYDKKKNGTFVEVKGMFLESVLTWGAYYLASSLTGTTTEAQTKELVELYLKNTMATVANSAPGFQQIYKVQLSDDSETPSSINMNIPLGQNDNEFLYDFLEPEGYSYYCTPLFNPKIDGTEPLIGVEVHSYKLADKTDTVYFGDHFQNVKDIPYTLDDSDQFPRYLAVQEIPIEVVGDFSGTKTVNTPEGVKAYIFEDIIVDSNKRDGFGNSVPIKVYETSVSDIEMIGANETLIHSQMAQLAKLDMLNHYKIETISADIIQNKSIYLTDYNLGDKCNIQISKLDKQFTVRIAEVNEVHSKNKVDIQVVLGTPKKTKFIKQI